MSVCEKIIKYTNVHRPPSTLASPIGETKGAARSYCYTINNPTEYESKIPTDLPPHVRFVIAGREVGETGTPHIQGYVEFTKPVTIVGVKKITYFARAHLEKRRGTREQAADYCMKDGNYDTFGEWDRGGQGARTDWHEIHDFIVANPTFAAVRNEFPEIAIKYTSGVKSIIADIEKTNGAEELKSEFESLTLYKWEEELLKTIDNKPDDRKIIWYVDEKGGRGKTTFAKYLIGCRGAAYLTNGRSTDIAHCYHNENIAIFDFCRSNEEKINYQIIESIKNGLIFSPKYDSMTKISKIPHVICFSNFHPDLKMLSQDRWDIRYLDDSSVSISINTEVTKKIAQVPCECLHPETTSRQESDSGPTQKQSKGHLTVDSTMTPDTLPPGDMPLARTPTVSDLVACNRLWVCPGVDPCGVNFPSREINPHVVNPTISGIINKAVNTAVNDGGGNTVAPPCPLNMNNI